LQRSIAAIIIISCLVTIQYAAAMPCGRTNDPGEGQQEMIGEGLSTEMVSGPECCMPWDNEREFIEAVARHKTYVMLGGYRTVLKDPLPGEEYNVYLAADLWQAPL